jgi:hypothetical protein
LEKEVKFLKKTNQELMSKANANSNTQSNTSNLAVNTSQHQHTHSNNSIKDITLNSNAPYQQNIITINTSLNLDRKYILLYELFYFIRTIAGKLLHKRGDSEKIFKEDERLHLFKGKFVKSKQNSDE